MRFTVLPLFLVGTWALSIQSSHDKEPAQVIIKPKVEELQYLIEFGSGETQLVTEEEKWKLKSANQVFMDITDFQSLGTLRPKSTKKNKFPKKVSYPDKLFPMFKNLTRSNIQTHLEYFTSFQNRFYKSRHGKDSSRWLIKLINDTINETGAGEHGVSVKPFEHPWDQYSIIVTIPGMSNSTVVIGAHQDSINYADLLEGRAPGADDDGSGTMTILEVMRVLLTSPDILDGKNKNTVEFHWYAAEEGGLLGSQGVFAEYEQTDKDVKAMFQQDMTGFTNLTLEAGKKPAFGLMMDIMDEELMNFVKLIIDEYSDLSWVETGCGRSCGSDHMSAIKAGYPAVFVIEADFKYCDKHLHGSEDLIKYLDYDHMVDHAQSTLAFVYELAFADL